MPVLIWLLLKSMRVKNELSADNGYPRRMSFWVAHIIWGNQYPGKNDFPEPEIMNIFIEFTTFSN